MARAWLESVIAPGHRWLPPETDTSHALATKRAGPELVLRSETSDTVNRHICRCRQRLKSSPPDSGLPRMAGRLQYITQEHVIRPQALCMAQLLSTMARYTQPVIVADRAF